MWRLQSPLSVANAQSCQPVATMGWSGGMCKNNRSVTVQNSLPPWTGAKSPLNSEWMIAVLTSGYNAHTWSATLAASFSLFLEMFKYLMDCCEFCKDWHAFETLLNNTSASFLWLKEHVFESPRSYCLKIKEKFPPQVNRVDEFCPTRLKIKQWGDSFDVFVHENFSWLIGSDWGLSAHMFSFGAHGCNHLPVLWTAFKCLFFYISVYISDWWCNFYKLPPRCFFI